MAWAYVFLAGVVEVLWVVGLRHSSAAWHWVGTGIMIVLSFYFIIKACEHLPAGTVYAVFTGLGAAGIALVDRLVFKTAISPVQFLFVGLIIVGVMGIKLVTGTAGAEQVNQVRAQDESK